MLETRNTGLDLLDRPRTSVSYTQAPNLVRGTPTMFTSGERPPVVQPDPWIWLNQEGYSPDERKPGQAEVLFDSLIALKMITSEVSMHLDRDWRSGLFRQLDDLLNPDEWELGDEMPSVASFRTFLRMIIHNKPSRRPGLGATVDGNIVAAWTMERDRLTVECLPTDRLRWSLVRYVGDERISSANSCPAAMLRDLLSPHEPRRWFG